MDLTNSFTVPLPPDEAWAVLLDLQRIAPCVPGAELLEVLDERSFKGKVTVKLGPISLAFVGTARFDALDAAAHRATVLARGSDSKGRGGADSTVQFRLEPIEGGTQVVVDTTVNLSGSVAQYGRGTGVIQAVASNITAQFAANLQDMLAQADDEEAAPAPAPAPIPPPVPVPPLAGPSSGAAFPGSDVLSLVAARTEAVAARAEAAAARIEAAVARVEAAIARAGSAPAPGKGAPSARPAAKPISAFSLIGPAIGGMFRGAFSRKRPRSAS